MNFTIKLITLLIMISVSALLADTYINFREPLYKDLDKRSVEYKAGESAVALSFEEGSERAVSVAKCSGVLINKTDILTAFHCYDNHRDASIKAHFRSGETYLRNTVKCSNSPIASDKDLDYVIIRCEKRLGKLSHVTRAKASTKKVKSNEDLFVVHHQCGGKFTDGGIFDGYSCRYSKRANYGKVLGKSFTEAIDSTIPGGPGSSGSPVFNKEGSLVGVLSSGSYHGRNDHIAFMPLSKIALDLQSKGHGSLLKLTDPPKPPAKDKITVKQEIKFYEPKGELFKNLSTDRLEKKVGQASVRLNFRTLHGDMEETVGCGGTLINETDVMTAYHCYEGNEIADLYTLFFSGESRDKKEVYCEQILYMNIELDYIIFRCPNLNKKIKSVEPVAINDSDSKIGEADLFAVQYQCGGETEGKYYSSYNCKDSKRVTKGSSTDLIDYNGGRVDTTINGGKGTSGSSVFNKSGELIGVVTNGSFTHGPENISYVPMNLIIDDIKAKKNGHLYLKSLKLNLPTTSQVVRSSVAVDTKPDTVECSTCEGGDDVVSDELIESVDQIKEVLKPVPSDTDLSNRENYRIETHNGVQYRVSVHCKFDYDDQGNGVCMIQDDYYLYHDDFIGVEKIGPTEQAPSVSNEIKNQSWIDPYEGYECTDGGRIEMYLGNIICLID